MVVLVLFGLPSCLFQSFLFSIFTPLGLCLWVTQLPSKTLGHWWLTVSEIQLLNGFMIPEWPAYGNNKVMVSCWEFFPSLTELLHFHCKICSKNLRFFSSKHVHTYMHTHMQWLLFNLASYSVLSLRWYLWIYISFLF